MKIITYFILLINLIVSIFSLSKRSKTNALSKSKQFMMPMRRPFGFYRGMFGRGFYRPTYTFARRTPLVYANTVNPLLVPLSQYATCPMNMGRKSLVGKSGGNCKAPCNLTSCVQLSFECCIYGFPSY